jgi:hypothetical protein
MEGEMDGACNMQREAINVYRISVQKSEGKRPLVRPSYSWEDNMKIIINRNGCECVD